MSLLSSIDGAIAAAGGPAYAKLVMSTGPVAWWPLDANLMDRIGARNGVIGGGSGVHAAALPADSAGSFDCAGVNWISVAHAAALKPAVGSLMVWFKANALGDYWPVQADEEGLINDDFAIRTFATGEVQAHWQVGGVETAIRTVAPYYTAGQIVQAIATWNGSGVAFYLDGNRIAASTAHTSGLGANPQDWQFGRSPSGTDPILDGMIDEIALWDRVLTRNEIYLLAQIEAPS
jgi:hypothetical protein